MVDLVERVKAAMYANSEWIMPGEDDALARAAIAEVLTEVERTLRAVAYDPAPYNALKYRLEAMRREALDTPT